jgi:pimeloyl-ACP methyl ester carboxylesterase
VTGAPLLWHEHAGAPGAPLVALVHGSMDRSAGLLKLSRRLDGHAHVLRYDRRGYGRSRPHPGPFGMVHQADDLEHLMAGRRGVVMGHSYGGNVALALAARRPDLVAGVVVYETPLSWLEWWPGTTAGGTALATQGDAADAAERFMRRLVGDEKWERLPPGTRAARREEGVAMVGELTDLREHAAWRPEDVAVPVVAVHGEHGAAHHRDAMAYLASTLADCRVVRIEGARHFGPNSHPDAVAAVVLDLVAASGGAVTDRRV